MSLYTVDGVDYCTTHHGFRNEDMTDCDRRYDAIYACDSCGGTGFADEHDECPDCTGFGALDCRMVALQYDPDA